MQRRPRLFTLAILLSATGIACGTDAGLVTLDAERELMLTSVSGEREALTQGDDQFAGDPGQPEPDAPSLDGSCDVSERFEEIFARYDEDASGELERPEEDSVDAERNHRDQQDHMRRIHAWFALELIYDADDSGWLEQSERDQMMADFTERCEVMHDRILEDFDADGDGVLSEEEAEIAREELRARREEHRQGERPEDAPEGGPDGQRPEDAPEGGPDGPRPDGPPPTLDEIRDHAWSRILAEWDLDGDGETDADERAEMRDFMRERVTSGDPLGPRGRCEDGERPEDGEGTEE